jgi:hypothetical protein
LRRQAEKSTSWHFYGWWVVATAALGLCLGAATIIVYAFGVFFKPLNQEFHVGRLSDSVCIYVAKSDGRTVCSADWATDRPTTEEASVEGLSWREIWHTSIFWLLVASFFLAGACVHACILHMPAMLTDRGVSAQQAAMASSVVGFALVLARVGTGYLLNTFFRAEAGGILFLRSGDRESAC